MDVSGEVGSAPLIVGIDARILPGRQGGVEQVILGLAHGLSGLEGPERYLFLTYEAHADWLRPFIGGPCTILPEAALPAEPSAWRQRLKDAVPALVGAKRRLKPVSERDLLPVSDGVLERAGAELLHFPKQTGFLTELPTIYQPHDLQHLHLPEFFSKDEFDARERLYRALCDQAAMITVTSEWGKRDLVEHYGLSPAKIWVMQLAPAVELYPLPSAEEVEAVGRELDLPERFVFYPAQTWPHKNHLRLLQALSILDARGLRVPLVCTGRKNEHFAEIEAEARRLGLEDRVRFLGFVEPLQLQALYRRCEFLVFPSLFEAAGGFGPISEAFLAGRAVAASGVTSLPEEIGDAGLIFDPLDPGAIADAVGRLWTDERLRDDLAARGRRRIAGTDWGRVSRTFRAHYRRIAGRPLSDEDRSLIGVAP